ncbi:MAG TPA: phenylalanine--tRNA ligase subunit alpha [Terriglobia bacterium]|nr:phenylalanine--tRNA ligase subunit alpha [Terriglobia bacterium]
MTIEEKAAKTLSELGIQDEAGVHALFDEVREYLDAVLLKVTFSLGNLSLPEKEKRAKPVRDRVLGRNAGLASLIDEKWLKTAPKSIKPTVGREFNSLKDTHLSRFAVEALVERSSDAKEWAAKYTEHVAKYEARNAIDLTLPGYRRPLGSVHPVTRVQREIEEIFLGLGFTIENGPEIESVYYNFDALNIPESHPSRDDFDTIYIDSKTLLRTHTSPVQIRAMEQYAREGREDGLYIIIPGKCYRNDNPDATHSPMFHQCEGLAVDKDITFADLKGTLDFFAKKFFGERTRTSFHPSFFPFTEPSGEVAVSCFVCDGRGCRTCKQSGWIEVMGCGMVHPQVLRNGGIDPERYSGWAFGLGIDRFAMIKYDISDIQHFFQSDVRFLEQF